MTTLTIVAKSSKYLPLMFSNANVSGDDFGSALFWSFFGGIARKGHAAKLKHRDRERGASRHAANREVYTIFASINGA